MTNDNFFSITGKNVSIKSRCEQEQGNIGEIRNFRIPAYSSDTICLYIKFKITEVLSLININSTGQNWKFAIAGDFMPLFFVKFIEFEIDIPKLLFQKFNLMIGNNCNNIFDFRKINNL
jgi:hypothetical protein